ncbi:hypothetical protein J437_LFUL016493 [Ladona fulva]|uniref:BEN domain-containing protein n=1 Tax=Ladona fulva TaxID=123851 RepID=A0A8K0P542_LADFU|nr:hypothetical protein J437_LFUL016493 [Ladona fulva]
MGYVPQQAGPQGGPVMEYGPHEEEVESPPPYDNDEEKEYKAHNMFVEYVPAQEPVCELSHEGSSEQILSEDKLRTASCVRSGQAGDSLFVKNLALAIWGAKTLASRSVTGKRCMAIKHSVAKPPLSPKKVEYIKEKFIERIRQNEPNVSMLELSRRVGKIRVYIADKIATLNRRST